MCLKLLAHTVAPWLVSNDDSRHHEELRLQDAYLMLMLWCLSCTCACTTFQNWMEAIYKTLKKKYFIIMHLLAALDFAEFQAVMNLCLKSYSFFALHFFPSSLLAVCCTVSGSRSRLICCFGFLSICPNRLICKNLVNISIQNSLKYARPRLKCLFETLLMKVQQVEMLVLEKWRYRARAKCRIFLFIQDQMSKVLASKIAIYVNFSL